MTRRLPGCTLKVIHRLSSVQSQTFGQLHTSAPEEFLLRLWLHSHYDSHTVCVCVCGEGMGGCVFVGVCVCVGKRNSILCTAWSTDKLRFNTAQIFPNMPRCASRAGVPCIYGKSSVSLSLNINLFFFFFCHVCLPTQVSLKNISIHLFCQHKEVLYKTKNKFIFESLLF